jgi:hypothetical protein
MRGISSMIPAVFLGYGISRRIPEVATPRRNANDLTKASNAICDVAQPF